MSSLSDHEAARREMKPIVESALERHLAAAREWFPHEYVPYEVGRNYLDEPWQDSDSKLKPIARDALELNLLTEDNLPYYHLAAWKTFGEDGAWGEWVRRWTAEEARHSIVIRDFLSVTRGVNPAQLERARMEQMSHGFFPEAAGNIFEGLVYTTLQELATRISHRNTGLISEDPIAERLLSRVAVDENLHYVFYRDVGTGAIERFPSEMVLAIRRQVFAFAMPGLELHSMLERAMRIATAGIYDLRIHHDQVLVPVLLKHWQLTRLTGLTDEAERARDEVVSHLEKLNTDAGRFEDRRAEQPEAAGR